MSILILGDLHIGIKSFSKTFFEQQMSYFENVVFPYIEKHDIKNVIQLGDLSHNRNLTDNHIDQSFKHRFLGWFEDNMVNFYTLTGNHDIYYKNTIEYNWQIANIRGYEYVHPITSPTIVRMGNYNIGMIPWMCHPNDIDNMPKPENVDYLMGHLEVEGALMHGNHYSTGGLSYKTFEQYKNVLSGHYHSRSQYKNIKYVGTPYQLDWGEYDSIKGFHVIEENYDIKFVENEHNPKHLKIYYYESEDGKIIIKLGGLGKMFDITLDQAKKYAKDNYVKFIIKRFESHELLTKYFEKITSNAFDRIDTVNETAIIDDFDIDSFHKEVKTDVEFISIIDSFIDNSSFERDLDKNKLTKMLNNLYSEATGI